MGKNPQNMLIQSGTNFSKFLSNHFSRFVKHVHFSSWHCKPGKFIPSIVRKILQNHLSRLCSTLHSVQIRCESFGMLCRKPGKWVGIRELRPDFVAKAFFWKAFIKEMLQVASNCGATHPADPNLFTPDPVCPSEIPFDPSVPVLTATVLRVSDHSRSQVLSGSTLRRSFFWLAWAYLHNLLWACPLLLIKRFAAVLSSVASFQVHRLPSGRPVILIPGEPALPVTLPFTDVTRFASGFFLVRATSYARFARLAARAAAWLRSSLGSVPCDIRSDLSLWAWLFSSGSLLWIWTLAPGLPLGYFRVHRW